MHTNSPPLTVLVVDDDALICRAYERLLRARGWRVLTAAGPREALAHYAAADVVLSDWCMPSGGGERVLRESPVPVVIHSASYVGSHPWTVAKPSPIDRVVAELVRALAAARRDDAMAAERAETIEAMHALLPTLAGVQS